MNRVAILDVDGTLVDTNYQHALAWYQAFRDHDIVIPIWQLHRRIGMGGDQLVEDVTDEDVESRLGEAIRDRQGKLYGEFIDDVAAFEGATELLRELHERGHVVILASSAKEDEIERYIDLLDARDIADDWTSSGDVEATKPAPDLVESALERADAKPADATMIGDSPWDAKSAAKAGVETVAVMTGGFSERELREAGATEVHESVESLRRRLTETSELH